MSLNANGTLKKSDIDAAFLSSPGEDIVGKIMLQMAKVPAFVKLFGPYLSDSTGNKNTDNQRWADYNRMDWSTRQLPCINIFESQTEAKQSGQSYLVGSISIQTYWPSSFRRSDLARVPSAFKGVLQNFFESDLARDMLDELYYVQRPEKVPGLNEIGKTINWSPEVEGLVASEMVPVTILEVGYRIDLRSWYRALEFQGRTKGQPFEKTLADLSVLDLGIQGVTTDNADPIVVTIEQKITNTNP